MWHKKPSSSGKIAWRLLLAVVLTAGAAVIFVQRQAIADHISVWQYQPSSEVIELADRSRMSDDGRFLFYASRPELLEADRFNDMCASHDPESATLGCYRNGMIYIYDIHDERLDGIREVTAAHEMLHAAYARFSDSERKEIDRLTDEAYDKVKTNKLANRLDMYDRNQPGTRYIELHAILGTEFRDITPELESHYSEYFDDRLAVVSLHESYEVQFTEREARAAAIRQELNRIADAVEAESAAYNRDVQVLSRDIEDFNARTSQVNSELEHRQLVAERERLVARTSELESRRTQIDSMIVEYDSMVEEYNSIATEVKDLTESLDSTLAPAPSV